MTTTDKAPAVMKTTDQGWAFRHPVTGEWVTGFANRDAAREGRRLAKQHEAVEATSEVVPGVASTSLDNELHADDQAPQEPNQEERAPEAEPTTAEAFQELMGRPLPERGPKEEPEEEPVDTEKFTEALRQRVAQDIASTNVATGLPKPEPADLAMPSKETPKPVTHTSTVGKMWFATEAGKAGTVALKAGSRMEVVLGYVKQHPGCTATDVVQDCGKAADLILQDLKRKGAVERR